MFLPPVSAAACSLIRRGLSAIAVGGLLIALGVPVPATADHGPPHLTGGAGPAVWPASASCSPNGPLTRARGQTFDIRISFENRATTATQFTATMRPNRFFSTNGTFLTRSVPAGIGVVSNSLISTASMPTGTDRVVIEVTSSATGAQVLARCDFTLTVNAPRATPTPRSTEPRPLCPPGAPVDDPCRRRVNP